MKHPIGRIAHELVNRHETRDPFAIAMGENILIFRKDIGKLKGFCCFIAGKLCIFVNEKLSPEMQRMVCAHELGHCILNLEELSAGGTFNDGIGFFDCKNRDEYEANVFAAFLLIDDDQMLGCLYNGWDFFQTASALYLNINFLAIRLMECPPPDLRIEIPFTMNRKFLKYISDDAE